MLAKRIIPCLDVKAGRVVKGVNFVGCAMPAIRSRSRAATTSRAPTNSPFLDITASSDERDIILHVVEQVAEQVFIPLTVGGGVRVVDDVRRLLNAGADKVSMNTAAVQNPQLVADASGKVGAVHRGGHRCQADFARQAGRCLPTAAARAPDWMPSNGRAACSRTAGRRRNPAHQHGSRRHQERLRSGELTRAISTPSTFRSSPAAVSATCSTWPRACSKAMPTRCWRPAFSITANTRCARPRSSCARAGIEVRL
jgi:hypothetical protein